MKRILAAASVALALGVSSAAFAQQAVFAYKVDTATDISAQNLLSRDVYAADMDTASMKTMTSSEVEKYPNIGNVDDLIVGRDGQVKAAVIGVGGFLGVGERDVAIDMKSVRIVPATDEPGSFFVVVNGTKQTLEALPAYETPAQLKMAATEKRIDDQANATTTAPAKVAVVTPATRPALKPPMVERAGYTAIPAGDITSDQLVGATLYGTNDESIGEVSDLVLTADGKTVQDVVLEVGGFLGLGEHKITVPLNELKIMTSGDKGDVRVYIEATEAQLKAQPEYKG